MLINKTTTHYWILINFIITKISSQKHPYHILTLNFFPLLVTNSSLWDYVTPTNVAIGVGVAAAIAFLAFTPQGHMICSTFGKAFVGAGAVLTGATKNPDSQPNCPSTPSDVFITQFPQKKKRNSESSDESTTNSQDASSQTTEVPVDSVQEHVTNTVDVGTQTAQIMHQYVETNNWQAVQSTSGHLVDMSIQQMVPLLKRETLDLFTEHSSQLTSRVAYQTTNETLRILYENEIHIDSQTITEILATNQVAVANGYALGVDGSTWAFSTGRVNVSQELVDRVDALTPATIAAAQNQQLHSIVEDVSMFAPLLSCILLSVGLAWVLWPSKCRQS